MARKILTPEQIASIDQCCNTIKDWHEEGHIADLWHTDSVKGFPKPYAFRAKLAINGETLEGVFVDCFYKKSRFTSERDKIYMTLCVNSVRTIALHDGPPATHTNTIGEGLEYYKQAISHPHMHRLVNGQDGYAEPVDEAPIENLWQLFLDTAKIHLAPVFALPPGQLELSV